MASNQNKQLSSYLAYKDKLASYGVDTSNMDDEDLTYNSLNSLNLTNDQKQNAYISLDNYLKDLDSFNTQATAVNKAENTARQSVAYQDYLNKRLGSYLGEIQEANGTTGYTGATEGYNIAMQNNAMNQYNQIQQDKSNTIQQALSDYQNSINANGKTALESQLAYNTEQEEKAKQEADTNYANALDELDLFLAQDGIKGTDDNDNAYISTENKAKLDALLSNYNLTDEQKSQLANRMNAYYSWANNAKSDEEITNIKQTKETEKYKITGYSGTAGQGGTITVHLSDSNGKLKNDDTTITLHSDKVIKSDDSKLTGSSVYQNASTGQVFVIDDKVFVKAKNGWAVQVVNYAGEGAYERLKNIYKGTVYEIS